MLFAVVQSLYVTPLYSKGKAHGVSAGTVPSVVHTCAAAGGGGGVGDGGGGGLGNGCVGPPPPSPPPVPPSPALGVGNAVTLPSMQKAARHLSRKVPFILVRVAFTGAFAWYEWLLVSTVPRALLVRSCIVWRSGSSSALGVSGYLVACHRGCVAARGARVVGVGQRRRHGLTWRPVLCCVRRRQSPSEFTLVETP